MDQSQRIHNQFLATTRNRGVTPTHTNMLTVTSQGGDVGAGRVCLNAEQDWEPTRHSSRRAGTSSHHHPVTPLGEYLFGRYHEEYWAPFQKACFFSQANTAATWQNRGRGECVMFQWTKPAVFSAIWGLAP